jgi:hypothetical protein
VFLMNKHHISASRIVFSNGKRHIAISSVVFSVVDNKLHGAFIIDGVYKVEV